MVVVYRVSGKRSFDINKLVDLHLYHALFSWIRSALTCPAFSSVLARPSFQEKIILLWETNVRCVSEHSALYIPPAEYLRLKQRQHGIFDQTVIPVHYLACPSPTKFDYYSA